MLPPLSLINAPHLTPADFPSELERQKTIAENRVLLDSLGLDPTGASKIPHASTPKHTSTTPSSHRKRKAPVHAVKHENEGPRRRSGRLAGLEAEGEELKVKFEEEEREGGVWGGVKGRRREGGRARGDRGDGGSPSGAGELVGEGVEGSC